MNKEYESDEAAWREVALGRHIHQEMHYLCVHLNLRHRLQELYLPLLVPPAVLEELRGDALEEGDWMIVVSFVLAAKVDAIYQADVALLGLLDIDQIPQDLQGVRLGELLEDESSLLLILVEHLCHQSAAEDTDKRLGLAVLLEQEKDLLDI